MTHATFATRLALLACLAAPSPARTGAAAAPAPDEADFYVAPGGDDRNPGTKDAPFATPAAARDAVRGRAKGGGGAAGRGVVVVLRGGTYRLAEPLVLGPEDSGAEGAAVTYAAYPGDGPPVLSGGRLVTGWQPDPGANGRWKAAVPKESSLDDFRQLYVNGRRAKRARGAAPAGMALHGKLDSPDEAGAGYQVPAGGAFAGWKNPADVEFGYYNSWSHMTAKVAGVVAPAAGGGPWLVRMQQPTFYLVLKKEGVRAKTPPDYVENAVELLDEPGEWYLDRPARTLYYLPLEGEDPAKAEVEAPALELLLELRGTVERPVRHVTFRGLTFACAGWLRPSREGHADVQANFVIDPRPGRHFERQGGLTTVHNEHLKSPANVRLHAAHDVLIEGCTFTRLGGAGLDVEHGSQRNAVVGCLFEDVSGSAVQIGDVLKDDHHPGDPRLVVADNRVTDCLVRNAGAEYFGSVGIFAGYAKGTVIAHNEITNLPYSGVSVGWGWGEEDKGGGAYPQPFFYDTPTPAGGNLVENNHVHDVMRHRDDGGAVYTLGDQPGTAVRGNAIHDNKHLFGGIYLDEGSANIEVRGNAVWNVPKPMNYNNAAQNRRATCREHGNFFGPKPGEAGFPKALVEKAGPREPWRTRLAGMRQGAGGAKSP